MSLKKCLLVTDDPDDHRAFTDVVAENHPSTVVLTILDSQRAIDLISDRIFIPDYLFVDLAMQGIAVESFLSMLKSDPELRKLPTALYSEDSCFKYHDQDIDVLTFSKDYTYGQLKEFLARFFDAV